MSSAEVLLRVVIVWLGLLVVAIVNGAIRETTLVPWCGVAVAHVISTLVLSAAILGVSCLTIGWIAPTTPQAALTIGGVWLTLTLAFEFLGGHYVFHRPWSALLADYDLVQGRIWPLVLIVTALAPWFGAHVRGLIEGSN